MTNSSPNENNPASEQTDDEVNEDPIDLPDAIPEQIPDAPLEQSDDDAALNDADIGNEDAELEGGGDEPVEILDELEPLANIISPAVEIIDCTKANLNAGDAIKHLSKEKIEKLCKDLIEGVILKDTPSEANISLESEFIDGFLAFGSEYSSKGMVKTPKHIAELMCDLAELTKESKVLDITCGTGTFLSAAFQNIKGKIPPSELESIQGNFAGFDTNEYMAGIAQNVAKLQGFDFQNIRKADCFSNEAKQFIDEFKPNVIFLNPPHKPIADQPHQALKFLKQACDMCSPGGTVIALMPIANNTLVYTKKAKTLRKELLDEHRLIATMEMDPDIFNLLPTGKLSNSSAIVIMKPRAEHQPTDEVWMAMWKRDGRRHKDKTGRIMDERLIRREGRDNLWQDMRQQWTTAFRNKSIVKLTEFPVKGREPLFGASHKRILWRDDEENWNGDWIASSAIPSPETKGSTKQFEQRLKESWEEYLRYSMFMKK